jgi:hypothetical protein
MRDVPIGAAAEADNRVSGVANRPRCMSGIELPQQLRDVDDPDLDAAMNAIVDAAPPLTPEARSRLAVLFGQRRRHPGCQS